MNAEKKQTIILTLLIDEQAQSFFNTKRNLCFPAFANFTEAHLTLFHCLPNTNFVFETIQKQVELLPIFNLSVTGLINNKTFNAYDLHSDKLVALHSSLQNVFKNHLSQKDLKIIKPHITIQNKTTVYKALKTYHKLLETFEPFEITAKGISCWFYSKNKWTKKADYYFNL